MQQCDAFVHAPDLLGLSGPMEPKKRI